MNNQIFERFCDPSTMIEAEQELVSMGEQAVPILESFFNGNAKNKFGIPYRKLGLPMTCALETARRIGSLSKPLEIYFREELKSGNHTAAMALCSLKSIEEESTVALAESLSGDLFLASESAVTLIKHSKVDHSAVLKKLTESEPAAKIFNRIKKWNSGV
ncbi:hypothetical protein [Zooshikella ganghwensis]|uniref:Uncharacterized protein n=1 Tax=Zooshikella ganghwensis TaxID=202772 RepID=A0A4P9VDV1_9GAMM|nr:hypothetical protein [Zooshikella ganghwensis]RDH41258.1 hypothetical protein B9G39_29560 [Zooshikella ganghwensis]